MGAVKAALTNWSTLLFFPGIDMKICLYSRGRGCGPTGSAPMRLVLAKNPALYWRFDGIVDIIPDGFSVMQDSNRNIYYEDNVPIGLIFKDEDMKYL